MKKITSFEAACKKLNIAPKAPIVTGIPKKYREAIVAHYKLAIIAEAINDGWEPNWDDSNEYKYYPWFYMSKNNPYAKKGSASGFGFSHSNCVGWCTHSICGSRLCFQSREMAEYSGKKFKDLYKQYMTIAPSPKKVKIKTKKRTKTKKRK